MIAATSRPPSESEAAPTPARKKPHWAQALGYVFLLLALALGGSACAVVLFGAQTYRWKAFDIEVCLRPHPTGSTRLRFIPLGEVRAATHQTPVALQISLVNISFEEAKALIAKPPPKAELERDFTQAARRDLNDFAYRQIALGAVGGLVAPILLRARRFRFWLLSSAVGGGFVALTFYFMVRTFNPLAFERPTYTGSLQQANWVITLVKDGFNKAEELSVKLRNVAQNLNTLYERIDAIPQTPAEADTLKILHISDIHNNPAAVAFVQELAKQARVRFVVDTGDLTDFGLPLEAEIAKSLARIAVPYVFVAGNHDSPAVIQAVRANPNAVILEGAPRQVEGVTLLGAPDPSAAAEGADQVDTTPEALKQAADALTTAYQSATPTPDILCVHNLRQAEPLLGKAKLILCGHEHRSYVETRNDTVLCNAGTTGAAGGRYFDKAQGVPLSASILTFKRSPNLRLLFIDRVILDGTLRQYAIHRETFPEKAPPAPAAPAPSASPAPTAPVSNPIAFRSDRR